MVLQYPRDCCHFLSNVAKTPFYSHFFVIFDISNTKLQLKVKAHLYQQSLLNSVQCLILSNTLLASRKAYHVYTEVNDF